VRRTRCSSTAWDSPLRTRPSDWLTDGARYHERISRTQSISRLVDRLATVGIQDARTRVRDYPHQFSGGMRQRAMVAMALMRDPSLIIADEPTTALDVSTERRVLQLLRDVCAQHDAALLLISHDLTVITRSCERVLVLYAGRIVEDLPTSVLHTHAAHPYTRALLAAIPGIEADRSRPLTVIPGRVPDATDAIAGCAFAARCPSVRDRCHGEDPALAPFGDRHHVACWNPRRPPMAGMTIPMAEVGDDG
jgi:oligopeptide/dipeptide ABC transporter ATP-binding protein